MTIRECGEPFFVDLIKECGDNRLGSIIGSKFTFCITVSQICINVFGKKVPRPQIKCIGILEWCDDFFIIDKSMACSGKERECRHRIIDNGTVQCIVCFVSCEIISRQFNTYTRPTFRYLLSLNLRFILSVVSCIPLSLPEIKYPVRTE